MNIFQAAWFSGPHKFTWLDVILVGSAELMDYIDEHPELTEQMNLPQKEDEP